MLVLSFKQNCVEGSNYTDSIELNEVFDIARIYHLPVQQDLAGNLDCPKNVEVIKDYDEIRHVRECEDCSGVGYYDGKDEIVTCKECCGSGEIDVTGNEGDYTSTYLGPIYVEYNGIKSKMDYYTLGKFVFTLQGKPCRYNDDSIIIDDNNRWCHG